MRERELSPVFAYIRGGFCACTLCAQHGKQHASAEASSISSTCSWIFWNHNKCAYRNREAESKFNFITNNSVPDLPSDLISKIGTAFRFPTLLLLNYFILACKKICMVTMGSCKKCFFWQFTRFIICLFFDKIDNRLLPDCWHRHRDTYKTSSIYDNIVISPSPIMQWWIKLAKYMGGIKCEKKFPVFHFVRFEPRIFISVHP